MTSMALMSPGILLLQAVLISVVRRWVGGVVCHNAAYRTGVVSVRVAALITVGMTLFIKVRVARRRLRCSGIGGVVSVVPPEMAVVRVGGQAKCRD